MSAPRSYAVTALWWIVVLLALSVWLRGESAFSTTVRIREQRLSDPGIRVFYLQDSRGAVTVMGDADLPIIQWLASHAGQRILVTLGAH